MSYVRLPGLFRRDEIPRIVESGKEYRFVEHTEPSMGEMESGPLFEVWVRDNLAEPISALPRVGCNRHSNCEGKTGHCFVEDCEDCFEK
jgi:hypothetical protein